MNGPAKKAVMTTVAGLGLLIPASIGLSDNGPTVLSPLPALTVLPAFALSIVHLWKAAVILPVLGFFLWHPRLFLGEGNIPKRSYALLVVATLLSIYWFAQGWRWGLEFYGAGYTYTVCIVNLAAACFLSVGFFRNWKNETSFETSLILHWILFAWLAWYAFPWLGEMI